MKSSRTTQYISAICLFLVFLGYFFFGTGWYESAQLIVEGIAPQKAGTLEVKWDSGSGFNGYEREIFPVEKLLPDGKEKHALSIRNVSDKGSSPSGGAEVVCRRIRLDGHDVDLAGVNPGTGHYKADSGIHLSANGEKFDLEVTADKHIRLEFLTNNMSGKAEIVVDGKSRIEDLYIANIEAKYGNFNYWLAGDDGRFTIAMDMPRYKIKSLRFDNRNPKRPLLLSSIVIHGHTGDRQLSVNDSVPLTELTFLNVNSWLKRFFQPVQFVLQILFALITTWLVLALGRLIQFSGGIRSLFAAEKRCSGIFSLAPSYCSCPG